MVDVDLRPVRVDDLELLLAWRSNPQIYEHFRNQDGPLSWEDHLTWFATRPDERNDYVIEYNGRRVGVVAVTEGRKVSVYIGETALWGEGVATAALRAVTRRHDGPLTAEIHRENEVSQRLFKQCGFQRVGDGEWLKYRHE